MTSLGTIAFTSALQGWLHNRTNILERLVLFLSTAILMFPALFTGYVLPYEQRWWGYAVGIVLLGGVWLAQQYRYRDVVSEP